MGNLKKIKPFTLTENVLKRTIQVLAHILFSVNLHPIFTFLFVFYPTLNNTIILETQKINPEKKTLKAKIAPIIFVVEIKKIMLSQ